MDINSLPEAKTGGGAKGPGLTVDEDTKLPKVDLKDLIGHDVGVIGFLVLPSKFAEPGDEQQDYILMELQTAAGDHVIVATQSAVLMQQVQENYEAENFPFRGTLQHKANQSGTYKYYTFA
jgi:hypothetical protein